MKLPDDIPAEYRDRMDEDWEHATPEQLVGFAILCALRVYHDAAFAKWAARWCSGEDRTCAGATAALQLAWGSTPGRVAAEAASQMASAISLRDLAETWKSAGVPEWHLAVDRAVGNDKGAAQFAATMVYVVRSALSAETLVSILKRAIAEE